MHKMHIKAASKSHIELSYPSIFQLLRFIQTHQKHKGIFIYCCKFHSPCKFFEINKKKNLKKSNHTIGREFTKMIYKHSTSTSCLGLSSTEPQSESSKRFVYYAFIEISLLLIYIKK